MAKAKLSFYEAKRQSKVFPNIKKTVQQNWSESIPLERAESRALSLNSLCRTADRLLIYDRPAGRGAKSAITSWKQKRKLPRRSVQVYLVRFSSKITDEQDFLKIGITNDPQGRFQFDTYRYSCESINKCERLTRKEALAVERRLHAMFSEQSYTPKLKLLSKGNTECFIDSAALIGTVGQVFSLVRKEMASVAQR